MCPVHRDICIAKFHKCRFNRKLSTPCLSSGDCWVTGVDWDIRTWLLNLLYSWISPPGILKPFLSNLSTLSRHLPLLCRVLSLRGFDELLPWGKGPLWPRPAAVWLPGPLHYKMPHPWTAWVAGPKVILEFILSWKFYYHFLSWASTQLHFFTVAENWKQIKEGERSSKASQFFCGKGL